MNLLLILYFIFPKIDLVIFDGIPTGIRLQDFIALFFLFKFINKPKFLNFGLLVLLYILSNLISSYFNDNILNTILAWMRIFEYYVIGYAIYRYLNIKDFKILIGIELIIITLQYLLILPNFDPGRGVILSSEYSGTFGTPAELSYFLGLLCFFYLERLSILSTILIVPIIISNGVKASILTPLVNFSNKISVNIATKILIVTFGAVLMLSIFYKELDSIVNFFRIISNIDFSIFDHGYFREKDFYFNDPSLPQTLNLRVIKWGIAIHLFLGSNFLQILFGNGLYIVGGALDSGIIRFIYEMGLVPLIFFFSKLFKSSTSGLLVIIFSNIFFDAWISSVTAPIIIAIYLKSIDE